MDKILRRARFVGMFPAAALYMGLGILFGFETSLIVTVLLFVGQIAGIVIYWLADR